MPDGGCDCAVLLEGSLAECQHRLCQSGRTAAVSGMLRFGNGLIAMHSAFGPLEQEKESNQDYVVAWAAKDANREGIRWAVALADGVTSSFAAELGAKLACFAALAELVTQGERLGGADLAKSSLDAAGCAIRRAAEEIEAAGQRFRPEDEFESTWEFIVAEGLLLQTTLTLAWLERETLHLAMVGDGGAALRDGSGKNGRDLALVSGVPKTSRVHAIGPKNHEVSELDVWQEHPMVCPALLALYTDGIRAGVGDDVEGLLNDLERFSGDDGGNPAQALVEQFTGSGREEFLDNLTVALIRWEE